MIIYQFNINFQNIGLSIIQNFDKKTTEMLYITVQNFEFCFLQSKKIRTMQLRIQYFNIDNNSSEYLLYPVIITPTHYIELVKEKIKFLFNVCIEQNIKAQEVLNNNFFYLIIL